MNQTTKGVAIHTKARPHPTASVLSPNMLPFSTPPRPAESGESGDFSVAEQLHYGSFNRFIGSFNGVFILTAGDDYSFRHSRWV